MKRTGLKICLSAALLAGLAALAGCGRTQTAGGDYASYSMVVAAWDTPQEVRAQVQAAGVTPYEYFDGDTLLTPGEIAQLGEKPTVCLLEGTYEAGEGDFILADGTSELTVVGAGAGKTLIVGGGGLRENTGAGLAVRGGSAAVTLSGATVQGFAWGVQVENASNVTLRDVELTQNRFAGVQLAGARDCKLENCAITGNGGPGQGETGYGLSLDGACAGNSGTGNTYEGNGNANKVDYPAFWSGPDQGDNAIQLAGGQTGVQRPALHDPVLDAQNARPTENALRYEMEQGGFYGAGVADGGKMADPSEGGYAYLFDGTITLRIDVPEAGSYRLFVVGGSDDGGDKCDYVQVNGGERYLVAYQGDLEGRWQLCQPGTETWSNGVLTPTAPAEGFALNEGENVITITANWGYSVYDCLYIEKIAP